MPHIDIKMFPGRGEELKKDTAEKIIEAAAKALGAPTSAFSVSIEDVKPEDWNAEVADSVKPEDIIAGTMYRVN